MLLARTVLWFVVAFLLPCLLAHQRAAWAQPAAPEAPAQPDEVFTQVMETCFKQPAALALDACLALDAALQRTSDVPPDASLALNSRLRNVLLELGRYSDAEAPARRALAAAEARKDASNQRQVISVQLDRLASTLQQSGKLAEAEPLFRRALDIDEATLGPRHLSVGAALNNLAGLLKDRGQLDEAEPLFRRALDIREAALGPKHLEVATNLNNLAGLLKARGQLAEAEPLFRRALDIKEAALGPKHPSIATSLSNLAGLLQDLGKLAEAEPLYRRALDIREAALGPRHPDVATDRNNLASVLYDQGKLAEAESLFLRALDIREAALGPRHPDVATSLNNLAMLLQARGKLAEAEPLFQRALDIQEAALGPWHPVVADTLSNLAILALRRDQPAKALLAFRRVIAIRESLLRTSPSEDHALGLLQSWQGEHLAIWGLPLLLPSNPAALDLALRTVLLHKSRTQDLGALVHQALRRRIKTDAQRAKFARMQQLLLERAIHLDRPGGDDKRKLEQRLLWDAQRLHQELSQELKLTDSQALPSLDGIREAVAATLDPDAALVEVVLGQTRNYLARSPAEEKASIQYHYLALVLYRGGHAEALDLGNAQDVHKALVPMLNALRDPREPILDKAQLAYRAVFASLDDSLKRRGIRRLVLSPEFLLQLLPWQALHDGTQFLLDRYAIRYVAAGRDLLRPSSSVASGPGVVLAAPVAPGQRPLHDAQEVSVLLSQRLRARLLLGRDATEANLAQAQAPFTLLLATHGKYRPAPPEQQRLAQAMPASASTLGLRPLGPMGAQSLVRLQDPLPDLFNIEEAMHRSVLLLTPDGDDSDPLHDGMLTAEEVVPLPLAGTQLVTMLACEGGLGALGVGQGVYGLRRAFLQAGAETVVSTLWSVEEKSASTLIRLYYDKLLQGTRGRVQALDEAMKELRSDKQHPQYSHPFYWAPFVVLGHDGPLRPPSNP